MSEYLIISTFLFLTHKSKTITDDVTLTLHDITLHFTFHSRSHLPITNSTHAYGFIMLLPRQPRFFARLARWQLIGTVVQGRETKNLT